jgi:tRNA (guanine37-N1)-methyltransferase
LIYLNPDLIDLQTIDKLHPTIADYLNSQQIQLSEQQIRLTYENYSAVTILRQVLKNESEQFSSFSVIGHLIHLNLKAHLDAYKQLIGQVLLDKNPAVQAVVNKLDAIDSTFRNFAFETLASRSTSVSTVVQVRESGCTFRFDFAQVYWNPRLGTEHERIVKLLNSKRDVVYDVFAGVGPFAVPVARSGCKVLANDLNPHSFAALQDNAKINKAVSLRAYNLDGREFIEQVIRDDLAAEWKSRHGKFELQDVHFHVLMNLPAIAVEFLSSFVGLFNNLHATDAEFRDAFESTAQLPTVHCYAFYKGLEDGHDDLRQRAAKYLNWPETESTDDLQVRFVRTVAPNKNMLRLTVRLPKSVLVTDRPVKRARLE